MKPVTRTIVVAVVVLAASLPVCPPIAHAQCIDYGRYLPWMGSVETPGAAGDVAVSGDFAYVVAGYSRLCVVNISDPISPRIVGSVDIPRYARQVAVSGSYAYVTTGPRLLVVDVSDPTSPHIVGSVVEPSGGYFTRVAVAWNHAYVTAHSGLHILDVSDPTAPAFVGSLAGLRGDIAVSGQYACVTDAQPGWDWGLNMVYVGQPWSPRLVGGALHGGTSSVEMSGDYAYVLSLYGRLDVVHLFRPGGPRRVGAVDLEGPAWANTGVDIAGNHAYIVNHRHGLQVVDISNTHSPVISGGVETPGFGSVTVSAGRVYVAAGSSGLLVFPAQCETLDDPAEMLAAMALSVSTAGFPKGIGQSLLAKVRAAEQAVERDDHPAAAGALNAFVNSVSAHRGGNLEEEDADALIRHAQDTVALLDMDSPRKSSPGLASGSAVRLTAGTPNPFARSSTMRFVLPRPSAVRIGVHDVAGRTVRVLLSQDLPQGDHLVTWDGRDDAGLRVGGGTYFIRLTAGDVSQTRKVVFLGGQ